MAGKRHDIGEGTVAATKKGVKEGADACAWDAVGKAHWGSMAIGFSLGRRAVGKVGAAGTAQKVSGCGGRFGRGVATSHPSGSKYEISHKTFNCGHCTQSRRPFCVYRKKKSNTSPPNVVERVEACDIEKEAREGWARSVGHSEGSLGEGKGSSSSSMGHAAEGVRRQEVERDDKRLEEDVSDMDNTWSLESTRKHSFFRFALSGDTWREGSA